MLGLSLWGGETLQCSFCNSCSSVLFLSVLFESSGGFDLKLNDKEVPFEGTRYRFPQGGEGGGRSLHEQSARQVSNSQPGVAKRQAGSGGPVEMSQSSLAMGRSSDEGIESMMQEDFNVAETLHNVSVFEPNRDSFPIITDHINDPNIMEEGNGTMKFIPNQMPMSGLFDIPIKGFNEGVTGINYNYYDLRLFSGKEIFSSIWLHSKKCFGKYFLVFGCFAENALENSFLSCFSHFLKIQTNIIT